MTPLLDLAERVEAGDAAAFPTHGGYGGMDDPRNRIIGGGLSKREMIAMHVLSGIATSSGYQGLPWDRAAAEAVTAADALLRSLASKQEEEKS